MMLRDATFSKTSLTCCTVTSAVYQKVLNCERRMTIVTQTHTWSV